MAKKKTIHYVDNKKFFEELTKFRKEVLKAKEEGRQRPPVPNYIGECFMKISVHLSHKSNFINYTYREDMVMRGVETCLRYIDTWSPEKGANPFAYFTRTCWNAFLQYIAKEKKELYTKYTLTRKANIDNITSGRQAHDIYSNYNDSIKQSEWTEEHIDKFIEDFESKREKHKKKGGVGE